VSAAHLTRPDDVRVLAGLHAKGTEMRAVFLDRDGVVCENRVDHVKSWDEFRFIPGSLTALRMLREHGLRTFVVTNQAIVRRGIVGPHVIDDIHSRMTRHVVEHGGALDGIAYCPHDDGDGCDCRKPQPGMLTRLASVRRVDLSRAYMVGDAWTDMAAGRAAGCRCVLVRTGRGAAQQALPGAPNHLAHQIVDDLYSAVEWILAEEGLLKSRAVGMSAHEASAAPRIEALRPL
jgi:D-glycero-D-manno-heptose 1,7-bisphosphate phosphatase